MPNVAIAVDPLRRSELLDAAAHLFATTGFHATSMRELAKSLNISNSRVCDLIDEMVTEGLLDEQKVNGDRRGRRGVSVRLNPAFGHILGFDMEAKRLRLVLTDFSGQLVWQSRRRLRPRRRP